MALKRNPDAMKELRVDVKTQDQWDDLLSKEGLIIVDAYAGWCGPCKAIESTFRRIRNETGDDLLHFAMAETDNIDSLEQYRERSKPTFLFFGGGQLTNVIRGCNAPLLSRSILHFLNEEHRILNGDIERKVFIDSVAQSEEREEEKQDEEKASVEDDEDIEIVEVPKEISVVIIKPDALKHGHADSIIQNIENCGVEILRKEERMLSKEEAAEFYKQHEGSEHFEQLIEFMSSGPVLILVLSKRGDDPGYGLIPEIRDLTGPKDVNLAKEEAPNSIRAQYGTDAIMNAVHSCDSSENAAKELAFFFPDFNIPKAHQKRKKHHIQRTLALIRPSAYEQRKDAILQKIDEAGFTVAMSKEMNLTREQAEEFYEEHRGEDYFESLINNMTSGPTLALCLAREDAVQTWRDLLGPKNVSVAKKDAPESLRAVFADDDADINPIHGAASVEAAEKELHTFFPPQATIGVIKPDAYSVPEQREHIVEKIQQAGFKISAQKEISLTKDLAGQFYKEHEGKEFFDGLTDYMSSGPTLFMILSREDAVAGFRALVGPTDPELAKEQSPNSLRALYATDSMKNAIHSSSNPDQAAHVIHEFFPEVELNPDGTVKEEEKGRDEEQEVVIGEETIEGESGETETKEENQETEEHADNTPPEEGSEEGIKKTDNDAEEPKQMEDDVKDDEVSGKTTEDETKNEEDEARKEENSNEGHQETTTEEGLLQGNEEEPKDLKTEETAENDNAVESKESIENKEEAVDVQADGAQESNQEETAEQGKNEEA